MKRLIFIIVVFYLSGFIIFAQMTRNEVNGENAFLTYKPIYFLIGAGEIAGLEPYFGKQLVKLQFSVQYELLHQFKTGLYIAYTQIMFWDLFGVSGPFQELNYNPELFFRFQSGHNFVNDVEMPVIDYFQIGIEHKSTGNSGPTSEGFDRLYLRLQLGGGDNFYIGAGIKYFLLFDQFLPQLLGINYVCETPYISDYISNFVFYVDLDAKDNLPFFLPQKISFECGPGGGMHGFDFSKGWYQLDIFWTDFDVGIRPHIQLWYGYGESLINYMVSDYAVRVGISLFY